MKCERQDFSKLFLAVLLAVAVVFFEEKSANHTSTEKSRKDLKIIKCKILRRNPIRPPPPQ